MKMRNLYLLVFIALTVQACQPEIEDLETAKKELSSLESEKKAIESKIEELQIKITALDTSKDEIVRTLVTLAKPESKPFIYKIQVPGVADSRQNIVVSAETMGNVTKIYAHEGDMVRKGQVLASIDSEVMRNQIAELETRLEFATELFEKQQRLWEQKIGSELQFLQAKNNKESLEQNLKSMKAQASKSNIIAPFSGYLDKLFVREGQTINMGMPAVRIVDLNVIRLSVDVSEKYIGQFTTKDSITAYFPSLNKKYKSKILNIGQVVSSDNRTFTVEAEIRNDKHIIKPNILADVTIPVYQNDDALVIPTSLVQQGKEFDFVYIATQGTTGLEAKRQQVKIGRSYNGFTEIFEGLQPEQELVNLGSRSVADGEPLRVQ